MYPFCSRSQTPEFLPQNETLEWVYITHLLFITSAFHKFVCGGCFCLNLDRLGVGSPLSALAIPILCKLVDLDQARGDLATKFRHNPFYATLGDDLWFNRYTLSQLVHNVMMPDAGYRHMTHHTPACVISCTLVNIINWENAYPSDGLYAGATVKTFNSCTKYLGSLSITHDCMSDCNPVSWSWMYEWPHNWT